MNQQITLIDETQKALIGTAILNKDRFLDLLEYPEDIFTQPLIDIYRAMKQLYENGMDVDVMSLSNILKQSDTKIDPTLIVSIYQMPTVINYKHLLETALHARNKKIVGDYAKDLFVRCQSRDLKYKDFLDEVVRIKDVVSEQFSKKYVPLREEMYSFKKEGKLRFYKTGIAKFDEKIIGLFQGRFYVFAASTGSGKSTLARQITYRRRFLFFTLEMTKQEIHANVVMQHTGIPSWKIIADLLTDEERNTVVKANHYLEKSMQFTVIDDISDINQIVTIAKSMHRRGEIEGVVVDYIQLCTGAKGENQTTRVGYISRSLKMLSQELKIPVIGLSQFSRGGDKENRQPELTDLRDSGSIENDANCVIFLYTKKENRLRDKPQIDIIVAKNRGGRVGIIRDLMFYKERSMITEANQEMDFDRLTLEE